MATLLNGRPIRERGGNKNRLSRKDWEPKHNRTATAAIADDAVFYDCAEVKETVETHLIPRRSITAAQGLSMFDPKREYEPVTTRELNHKTGELETVYGDRRVVWTGDRNLLRRGTPDQFVDYEKRITSQTKQRQTRPDPKTDWTVDSETGQRIIVDQDIDQIITSDPTELPFGIKTTSVKLTK